MDDGEKPKMLYWTDLYALGITSLDAHHLHIILLANVLFEAYNTINVTVSQLEIVVEELIDFTVYSLDFETDCLVQFEYAERQTHIEEHESFKRKIGWFKVNIAVSSDQSYLKHTIFTMWQYLHNWLNHHIIICDKRFASLLIKKGVK